MLAVKCIVVVCRKKNINKIAREKNTNLLLLWWWLWLLLLADNIKAAGGARIERRADANGM